MTLWDTVVWDVARAGGFTAYILLTLSVVLGLALSLRWQAPGWPRLITNELHSFTTLLSLVFIGIHVFAVLIDPYTHFGLPDVLVPLATTYRPMGMALGIVATYLAIAVWLSTQLRPHIGYRWWRRFHMVTFVVYLGSTLHGLVTGSDSFTSWAMFTYLGSFILVSLLVALRITTPASSLTAARRVPSQ
jgi:predicted ferric reductase